MSVERDGREKRWTWAAIAILLLAFAARTFWLDRQFLWWDEGISVYLANQRVTALVAEVRATHHTDPPVYNLALAGWRVLAGNSPYAVRFLSVLAGVALVAFTWVVGRWLTDRNTALLATLFAALTPLLVHYARQAKGYTFAAAFALLSVYAWGRGLGYSGDRLTLTAGTKRDRRPDLAGTNHPSRLSRLHALSIAEGKPGLQSGSRTRLHPGKQSLWWIVYVLSTFAAVGAHYYLALLVVWQGLWVAGGAVLAIKSPARRAALKRMGQWVLAAAAIALPLAAWVLITFDATVQGVEGVSVREPLSLFDCLGRMFGAFGAGPGAEGAIALIGGCAVVLSIGIGILSNSRQAFLLSWFGVPLLTAYLVQSAYSFFYPRFLLYLGPPCYLLAGLGIAALGRRSRAIAALTALAIVGLWLPGLARAYVGPPLPPVEQAEDPRPFIAHLRAQAQPDDALAYGYIWQVGYLLSYDPQNQMTFYRAHYTAQNVGAELESIFASHPRLWLLSYRIAAEDPANRPATWLEGEAYKVESNWYGPHHLALYLAPDFTTAGVGPAEGTAVFDERIELHYPPINTRLKPGDVLALPLHWRAITAPGEDYHAFVHLGVAGVPPLAQSDGPPCNGLSPTGAWTAGQEVLDRRALMLPDTLPPGRYQVFVGLYRPSNGSRLPVGGPATDILSIGDVQVER